MMETRLFLFHTGEPSLRLRSDDAVRYDCSCSKMVGVVRGRHAPSRMDLKPYSDGCCRWVEFRTDHFLEVPEELLQDPLPAGFSRGS
jgi:hypothetical protein